jgi:hypothetical protein
VIWTTTAWTIPANQALNLNPELEYALVDTPRGYVVLAASLVEKALARYKLEGQVVATTKGGKQLGGLQFRHPLYDVDAAYRRLSPVYLADYATAEDGTGIVHSSPAYGVDDFNSCIAHGLTYDDILNPVQGNGSYAPDFALFGGQNIWKAAPVVIETLEKAGRLFATETITHSYPHCWRHKSPVIYRAAAQWFIRMDEGEGVFTKDKAPPRCADGAGRDRGDRLLPRERQGAAARHDRRPARLVHQPPAQLGRAPALLPAQGHATSCIRRRWRSSTWPPTWCRPAASRPGARRDAGRDPGQGRRRGRRAAVHQEHRHPGGVVRLGHHAHHRAQGLAPGLRRTRTAPRPTCTWKATTSTAAGSIPRCSPPARCTAARPTAACSRTASRSTARAAR